MTLDSKSTFLIAKIIFVQTYKPTYAKWLLMWLPFKWNWFSFVINIFKNCQIMSTKLFLFFSTHPRILNFKRRTRKCVHFFLTTIRIICMRIYVNVCQTYTHYKYFICNNYIWSNTYVHCSGKKPTLIFETTFLWKYYLWKLAYIFSVFDYKRVLQKTKPKRLPPF